METTPPVRVLLVEDYADLAEATADLLSAEGLDVRTALSGRDALEVARAFLPQLVLCDQNLPDMKGLDVLRELRSRPSTAQSYNVILTAMTEMAVANRAAPGVDAVTSKPISIDSVRTLVEELGQRALRTHP
jgi:two-component system alkaline phosphatase synthesis response regulator PhoP